MPNSSNAPGVAPTDFANILFAGPCNRHCPDCIGKQLPERVNANNLDLFPPHNIETLIAIVNRRGIRQIVLTGTTTDPQRYCCEAELLTLLRARITTGATYALHTNGVLALSKMAVLNQYDKATISFPSFEPETYARLMGSSDVPDLAHIVAEATIPVKVSLLLSEHNVREVGTFLHRCADIGVQRVVLRRRYGETRTWDILKGVPVQRHCRGNPVYTVEGMEVTYWTFETTTSTSINLFADGTLSTSYLLLETPELWT
jgi:molybdenum cofactor biosynthesis enzyme MoaA